MKFYNKGKKMQQNDSNFFQSKVDLVWSTIENEEMQPWEVLDTALNCVTRLRQHNEQMENYQTLSNSYKLS
jgi:hypothetical protein